MNEAKVVGNNALVLGTKQSPSRVEEQHDEEVSLIEQKATALSVETDDDYIIASELTKQVKQMQKQVTDYWEPMRKSTYEAYTAVNQHKKQMLDPLAAAEKILKRKIGDFAKKKEQLRLQQEEAMRKAAQEAMDRKLDEAAEAEASGDAIGAEFAMAEAELMEGVSVSGGVQASVPKVKGVSQSKTWKITKIDSEKVPISFAGMELRPVDEKLVLQLIKTSKGTISIPGVMYEEDVVISVR